MAANTGEIDAGDLASYAEVCELLHNAERREREAKRRLRLVQEGLVHANATGLGAAETRQVVLEAVRGRRLKLKPRKAVRP